MKLIKRVLKIKLLSRKIQLLFLSTLLFFLLELKFFNQSFGSYSAALNLVLCQIYSIVLPLSIWFISEKKFKKDKTNLILIILMIILSLGGILLINNSSPI
ncbi:MAG TPA: hypothetical protein VHA52_09470, partial [Candidatus Babeliaceae bacterium]|nr:hypothetical protein [Candidatus Babeliaceae bacterium]